MDTLNLPAPQAMDLLRTRRSAKAAAMTGPGPDSRELATILEVAGRVPDHGKLAPWRFITFAGDARTKAGAELARIKAAQSTDITDAALEREKNRFLRAPLVIAVVFSPKESPKVPAWEQVLSAGAACQNLLLAAHTLGYVGSWLTEWFAYDADFLHHLGLSKDEKIAGYIYIGKSAVPLTERPRADVATLTHAYGG